MLAIGRYAQWQSRFLRYIDTRPKGDALRKCILEGPYQPTTVTIPAVPATKNSLEVPERTTVEIVSTMSPENKDHYESEKEAIHLILTGVGDELYSTVDACKTAHEMWEAIERLPQVDKMQVNVQFLQQLQPEWSSQECSAQPHQDSYYQTSKSHKAYAPTSKASLPTRSHATTRHKGKEIAKPITPPSESPSDEDSDPEQAQKDKEMQKNLALIAKYFKKLYKPTNNNIRTSLNARNKHVDTTPRDNVSGQVVQQSGIQCFNCKEFGNFAKEYRKPKRVKDSTYHKEKMLSCKQAEKGDQIQAEQSDWLADMDEEIDKQELEAHYSYMEKIQEVPNADSGTDFEPLEQVQYDTGYNVFANEIQHSEQSKSISNTCEVEMGDSNVILDSPDMCDNDIQNDQNAVECDDERVALANLIANLKLDYKSILAKTSRTLGESNSIRDSCLVALQNKQTELEKYMAFNDRIVDYDKLEHKLNETLGLLAQKDNDIKEGLKLKAYEILVVQEKHDELVKQSLLTKSHYEGLVKEKTKVITDLKLKEEKDIDKKKELVDQAWVKHSKDHFRAPTAKDMEILIKTCLMPLALKTQNDSFAFVHELKKEMHADLKYVESLENEIDELESDKAEFSNMYDMLLQECVSNDVMCSYLHSLSDLDAHTELQCLYLHKVKECECLAQKLSKQTEFVSKEVYTELLRSFAKLEKHSISLELTLQQCQEQMKNDTVCKEKASNVFLKEREQYFEIQDLKAQLQDKDIAICELKKLIEKCKGKSMETKFDKPSVVRQPNAQRIPKPSVLGKPTPFSDSLERKHFSKTNSVPKTNVSEGLSKPVTIQNLPQTTRKAVSNTNVIKPGMYQIDTRTTQTRAPQLPQTYKNTNPCMSTSTGVTHRTSVSRPTPRSTQMKDKAVPNTSQVKFKKTEVEDHHRISSISNKTKSVTACNDSSKSRTSNVNVVCATCGKCVFNSNHDACVYKFLNDVNARTKKPKVVPISTRKPKSQANKSVATYHKKTVASESTITNSKSYYRMLYEKTSKAWKWWIEQQCPSGYKWVPKTKMKWVPKVRNESVQKKVSFAIDNASRITNIVQLILFIVNSGCTKHMTGNLSLLCNFVEKYLGTVRFGNDQFAPILGYGDLVQGNITINKGNDLLTGNRGSDLYTISLQETTSSTPICLMAKASPTQAWLWHQRLSHLNFDYINLLSKKDVMIGLPKLKYVKDQLCSSCEVSKAKRSSFKTKTVPNDYSKYTWTLFLRSKDETSEVLKDFLKMIQRNLQALVISVRTDKGTEFLNKTLNAFFKEEGIEHQTSTPRTPEQNGVVERQNHTLVEAAQTMLSASKLPVFLWAKAIATACYTQNRSIIILTHEKMAYHTINDRKPLIKHLHIFGCTCYLTKDGEILDKMKEKGDPCILVGYSTQSKGYRVYNKRTRLIVESIHLKFDEFKEMYETSIANDTSGLVPQ
ncbi:retrovirus-related pol polyprotein from transposon TNT 1-94 [Tanacetum coccineum]